MIVAEETIKKHNLFQENDVVGVACSGGIDSMCLLHFLLTNRDKFNIKVEVINVNHCIRKESESDSYFVKEFCEKNKIKFHYFEIDCLKKLDEAKSSSLEEIARNERYKIFDNLLRNKVVNKIALAHHQKDQVETVLLNIFRGAGLQGASGMKMVRDNYIRPFINEKKSDIEQYARINNIEFVIDDTNNESKYSRNFIRNEILPLLKTKWKNIEENIINFANICSEDNEFINSNINLEKLIFTSDMVKIPIEYFSKEKSILNRVIFLALQKIGIIKDIERKHLELIIKIANEYSNGAKIDLPNNLIVQREYDYVVIYVKREKLPFQSFEFKIGCFDIPLGKLKIKKINKFVKKENLLIIDGDKLPLFVEWRIRKEGDIFVPFNGKQKKLKEYLIDKKITSRLRNDLPLLASGNEILVIANVEISDKIKVDENSKNLISIELELNE